MTQESCSNLDSRHLYFTYKDTQNGYCTPKVNKIIIIPLTITTYSSPISAFKKVLFPQLCWPNTLMQMSFWSTVRIVSSILRHISPGTISRWLRWSFCIILWIFYYLHNQSQQVIKLSTQLQHKFCPIFYGYRKEHSIIANVQFPAKQGIPSFTY